MLDDAPIEKLSVEDKDFIQEFKNLELISFNSTKIASLQNFPTLLTLKRVSIFNHKQLTNSKLD